ncbi:MAG: hypothetical protein LQ338_001432 [Usnochroma carphineum]|nr:MAG: hypothetical protein LQ338_001432 [Usnochroma carphineum]
MASEEDRPTALPESPNGFYLSLVVPKHQVKTTKQALEAKGLTGKTCKITPFIPGSETASSAPSANVQHTRHVVVAQILNNQKHESHGSIFEYNGSSENHFPSPCRFEVAEQAFVIPTNFEVRSATRQKDGAQANQAKDKVLSQIGLLDQADIEAYICSRRRPSSRLHDSNKSPLSQAVRKWLHSLPSPILSKLPANLDSLLKACRWTYSTYPPMLLLAPTFLSKDPWPEVLAEHLSPYLPDLYDTICQQLKVTHIAINAPIPALLPNSKPEAASPLNILRSPSNLMPLHGDFGQPGLPPTEQNFRHAFWVSTLQNDITQIWAPLYTMFSRGNISEKTRLLKLVPQTSKSTDMTAVDLYAGVGYFAFSYAKAGIAKILCWELNGWSIEGLRRGAEKNGWTTKIVNDGQREHTPDSIEQRALREGQDQRFLIFHESNQNTAKRVEALRNSIPPIRHVNCGYLPSSSESWSLAVQVLDPVEGGWIHAHENVAAKDIEQRKREMINIFEGLERTRRRKDPDRSLTVECQHVERVKTYAPGIIHCVFDIAVLPPAP